MLFRSGKEKNIFVILVFSIFLLFFVAMFLIKQSYALPEEIYQENSNIVSQSEPNSNQVQVVEIGEKNIIASNDSDLKSFSFLAVQGQLIPKSINLNLNDKVKLELNALDGNYQFTIDDYNIDKLVKQGGKALVYFQANNLGENIINLKSDNMEECQSYLIINN